MVQINTYSFSQSGQRITPNLSHRTRKIEFQVVGGAGGGAKGQGSLSYAPNEPGGDGGTVSGTYRINISSNNFIRVYPGETVYGYGTSEPGTCYFGSGGQGGGGGGGAMSALAIVQEGSEGFLAVGGGGGGAGGGNSSGGSGGGGGFPGGSGASGSPGGSDADTISKKFAQGLGGDGRGVGYRGANNGRPGGTAVAKYVSNLSTGTGGQNGAYVNIQTYGLPEPITNLTTSLSSNNHPILSWSAANNGITQRIYRQERNENFSQIATTSDNSGTFTDTSTQANTTYSYKIVQNNNYYQEGNISTIHIPSERVQVYRNGNWEPASLNLY
jgi:hypothetical protein